MKVFRGKLESACLSVHVSVCQSVCTKYQVCESTGGGIKSHLVTALVFIRPWKTVRIMLSPVAGGWRPPFFVWSISPRLC